MLSSALLDALRALEPLRASTLFSVGVAQPKLRRVESRNLSLRRAGRQIARRVLTPLIRIGVNPVTIVKQVAGTLWFRKSLRDYEIQRKNSPAPTKFPATSRKFKIVTDRFESAGTETGHYFHQDLWVARRIFERNPNNHVDFGSRIDGFVAHVASFRSIQVGDIRPLHSPHESIGYFQVDLMKPDSVIDGMTDSASCLHALEHFGLGRYGDPIDYQGWSKGLRSLTRVVAPGGYLYLSVPISTDERVEFNAHRVFSIPTIHDAVQEAFEISEFVYVDDHGDLHTHVAIADSFYSSSFGLAHGCGIWELRKKAAGAP